MPNDLLKATGGTLDIGIDDYSSDFSAEINLDSESYNLTSGVYRGIGPRFGMAPIPGQNTTTVTSSSLNTIQGGEALTSYPSYNASTLTNRNKIYGIIPLKLASYEDQDVEKTYYFWIMGVNNTQLDYIAPTIDLFFNCTKSGSIYPTSDDIRQGFPPTHQNFYTGVFADDWYVHTSLVSTALVQSVTAASGVKPKAIARFLLQDDLSKTYLSSASFSSSGRNVSMDWLWGVVTTTSTSTTPPDVNFTGDGEIWHFGQPSDYQQKNFKRSTRTVKTFSYYTNYPSLSSRNLCAVHSTDLIASTSYYSNVANYSNASPHLAISSLTATRNAFNAATGSQVEKFCLVNDPDCFTNTAYQAILCTAKRPLVWILQPWVRNTNGIATQYVDLVNNPCAPRSYNTGSYTENGTSTPSCFTAWPAFVRGTALASARQVQLTTTANTGILRANSVYEFGFSFYNKRLDFESNVGTPVKIQTGTTDYVALQLWSPSGAGINSYFQDTTGLFDFINLFRCTSSVVGQFSSENLAINEIEYRFYYRREGAFEWLPALFVDAAKLFFYPYWYTGANGLQACQSAIAGLPGGQPGGFIDNSFLPDKNYDCVLNYKNRIWWFSSTAIYFSLSNNLFIYPVRNSISSRTGSFKGGLVHNFPGQAEQTSRLLIFGTKEVYVARFTGNLSTAPVQVSDNTIGEYPVDASDLIVDTWTTSTAFSHRSAVVAEGYAYWWGPTGVYKDDGVNTPRKISLRLEPRLNTLYDTSKTDDIHCSYNETAKEITWFYKPRNAGESEMKGLTWNIIDEEWTPQSYTHVIDQVFSLKIDTNIPTAGNRMISIIRSGYSQAIQRPYFYDYLCAAGDMSPGKDYLVSTISTPSTGVRRLTLAPGYDSFALNFSTLAVGDLISIDQALDYATTMTAADDMLAKIVALGAGTIDILLPTGAAMDSSATLTQPYYFPIWHATANGVGLNGFLWSIKTKYWTPFGLNFSGNWLWLYILHKLNLVKSNAPQTYDISYRTPVSGDFITDTVTYADNSDGNWQLYHALRTGKQNNQGQAIKFILGGRQIASELVLQFLELHGTEETGNVLKQFEG